MGTYRVQGRASTSAQRSSITEELSGRRIVVPETRELGQLVRMLEEHGAEAIPCPTIAIRDAPDAEPVEAWLRWFVKGTCDDLVLMTGEGLRRLLGFARRTDLEFGLPLCRSARHAKHRRHSAGGSPQPNSSPLGEGSQVYRLVLDVIETCAGVTELPSV